VVLLHPGREEDYVSFLEVRKTPVAPFPQEITISEAEAAAATEAARKAARADRAVHDRGQKAFVSWLRSYSKHQASSIFRVADLDWEGLGKAWGLLKLPKMPELRNFTGDKTLGVKLDWDTYAYKDKQREKRRLEVLQEMAENPQQFSTNKKRPNDTVAWSNNAENRDKKLQRREKKHVRQEKKRWDQMTDEEKRVALETQKMVAEIKSKNDEERRLKRAAAKAEKAAGGAAGGEEEFEGFD
jgi:ATP-dependent RNA helicase DDX55/SPB4